MNESCRVQGTRRSSNATSRLIHKWLFFQNVIQVIQVQLQGGKTPIVVYWEMKLQADLYVSNKSAAAASQQFN